MAYILPVSAFRHPYTSPNLYDSLYDSLHDSLVTAYPPLPIMRWTEKSFMLRLMFSSRFFHWQNLHRKFIKIGQLILLITFRGKEFF